MLRPPRIALLLLTLLVPRLLSAQFAGTYVVGVGGDFATLTVALTALRNAPSPQLAGHVTLLLSDGTHTPTTGGFVVPQLAGAGPEAILTIRPAPGATVEIRSGTTPALIDLNGADYVVIDGHDSMGGGSLTIACSAASGSTVRFVNGATHNTIRNLSLLGSGSTSTFGVVRFDGTNNGLGNTDNVVIDNIIGDTSGTLRANAGVTMIGNSAAPNLRNRIVHNEIVNPGRGSGVAYGVYLGSNNGLVVIQENEIHCTAVTGTEGLHPLYGLYMTNSANQNDTIARNRIHSLVALNPSASRYGMYISTQGTSPIHVISNTIALESDSGLLAGIHTTEPDSIFAIGNTILLSGAVPTAASTQGIASTTKGRLWLRDNLVVIDRPAMIHGTSRCLSISTQPHEGVIDRNAYVSTGDSCIVAARGSALYDDIVSWRDASGFDGNSVTGPVTFVDPTHGDLHIDPRALYCGEGMGTPSSRDRDVDGEERDSLFPDIGADEGDFNGGRLRLIAPDDSVVIAVGMRMTLTLAATRAVEGIVQLIPADAIPRAVGRRFLDTVVTHLDVTIPMGIDGPALLRLVNPLNDAEADTSDAPVIIVDPRITIDDVGGDDEIVEGDTLMLEWSAADCPGQIPLELALTTDNGTTWRVIDTTLRSSTMDGMTTTAWIVPEGSAGTARLRLVVRGDGAQGDTSTPFAIVATPTIDVDLPPEAPVDRILVVRWNAVGCRYVRVLVSTDDGETWSPLIQGNPRIPAWIGRASGRIPAVDSSHILVRVVDARRPRIHRSASVRLTHPWLFCSAPARGDRKRIGEPIDIIWRTRDVERLRIEYSDDDGETWTTVVEGIDGRDAWRRYVPEHRPTARARVRIVDMDNADRVVVSDRFSILPARSIMPLAPSGAERLERGSTTEIAWVAEGIEKVSLYYTTNNGATWIPIALEIDAAQGSHRWTLPPRSVDRFKIRIRESGGVNYCETGTLSIVDPEPSREELAILSPTRYHTILAGDEEEIRWKGTGFRGLVRVEYTVDSGTNWIWIATTTVGAGRCRWTAPLDTTSRLLIRVSSVDLDLSATTPVPLRIVAAGTAQGDHGADDWSTCPANRSGKIVGRRADDGNAGGVEVIPNPVASVGRAVWRGDAAPAGPGEGALYDLAGRCWLRTSIDESSWNRGEFVFDMTGLPDGLFVLIARRGAEVVRTTVVHAAH